MTPGKLVFGVTLAFACCLVPMLLIPVVFLAVLLLMSRQRR